MTNASTSQVETEEKLSKQTAERFLTLLAEDVETFTFQTFDDDKSRKNSSLTKILHGSLDQHFDTLCLYTAIRDGLLTKAATLSKRAVGWPEDDIKSIYAARVAGQGDDVIREHVTKLLVKRLENLAVHTMEVSHVI
jgi:hypothetical protein